MSIQLSSQTSTQVFSALFAQATQSALRPADRPSPERSLRPTLLAAQPTMKAMVQSGYGIDKLELKDVPKPDLTDDTIVVRVRAASVNALDWHTLRMPPLFRLMFKSGVRKPKRSVPGMDMAGVVEAVGSKVTGFKPGDEVIGHKAHSMAEYVRGKEASFVPKPARISFEQAAALPVAGLTALQGLRDQGGVTAGTKVLINGAGGGVGSLAVQIAKALGADVTAVTGARTVEMVRALGADRVIDRAREDFARDGHRYDVILDVSADRSISDCRRALASDGTLVLAGAAPGGFVKIIGRMARARLAARRASPQKLVGYLAQHNKQDLLTLAQMAEAGKLTPVVDRTFPLKDAAAAIRYLGERRAQGKVVVTV